MRAENTFPEIETEEDLASACMVLAMLLPAEVREPLSEVLARIIQFSRRHAVEQYKAQQEAK